MINSKKRLTQLPAEKYLIIFDVRKSTFDKMLKILEKAHKELHKLGGRPSRLRSVLDKLIIMLGDYHDYRTMENIPFEYGVYKQRSSEAIAWVEQVLTKNGTFALPSKRKLLKSDNGLQIVIADAT
ncbi:MAG: hypothetical protein LBF82_01010 [Lactobacillales bacterium]|jgi:hypothetical protein|nr:hypothetical protein [Lactobacillales bacterium]